MPLSRQMVQKLQPRLKLTWTGQKQYDTDLSSLQQNVLAVISFTHLFEFGRKYIRN